FYIVLTGNFETLRATENWSTVGGGGAVGFNWTPKIDIEIYLDYLSHKNPYASIAEALGETITMKSLHAGGKFAYTFATVFILKGGLGLMKLNSRIGEEPASSENHLEMLVSGGLILPIGGLDIITEGKYRRIFAEGADVNMIGIAGGLILYF
ncbi:MAG: hypothetical protein JXA66_01945, partial [Oligoflexia bacterium]|nr:hypothetical protein [Oligoflexia bacterium]